MSDVCKAEAPGVFKDTVPTGGGGVAPPCKFCGIESTALPWPTCSSMEEFRQCFGDPGLSLGRDHPVAQATPAPKVGVMPSSAPGGEVQETSVQDKGDKL